VKALTLVTLKAPSRRIILTLYENVKEVCLCYVNIVKSMLFNNLDFYKYIRDSSNLVRQSKNLLALAYEENMSLG